MYICDRTGTIYRYIELCLSTVMHFILVKHSRFTVDQNTDLSGEVGVGHVAEGVGDGQGQGLLGGGLELQLIHVDHLQ